MIDFHAIAAFFISNKFIFSFCGTLIAIFIVFAARFTFKIITIIKTVKQAGNELEKFNDRESFAVNFREFTSRMRKDKILGQCWREFEGTIVHSVSEEVPVIRSYEEVELYFNEQSVLASNLYSKFYRSLPNYLTGGGILGTFIGLTAGIYLANQGLSSADQTLLQKALTELLEGASLAFATSICGLFLSIGFSVYDKLWLKYFKKAISRFTHELSQKIEHLNPVALQSQQLEQAQKQTDHMEAFVNEVAYNIADRVNDGLSENIVPALEKLSDSINSLRHERGDSNERLLRELVASFKETMSSAAGNEISALGQSLKDMNQSLQPLLENTRQTLGEMQEAAQGLAEGVRKSYQDGGNMFTASVTEALEHMTSSVEDGAQKMRQAAGGLADSFRQSCQDGGDTLTGQINSAIDVMTQSVSKAGEQLQSMAETLSHGLADSSSEAATSFQNAMSKTMANYSSHISTAGKDMENRIRTAAGEATDRLGGLVGAFEDTIKKIESSSIYQAEAMGEAQKTMASFQAVEQSLSSLANSSRETSREVKSSAEKLASAAMQADSSLQQITHTSATLSDTVDRTHKIFEQLNSTWQNHLARFEGVDETLAAVFDKLQIQWKAYAETTSGYTEEIQNRTAKITDNFSAIIGELKETIDNLIDGDTKH